MTIWEMVKGWWNKKFTSEKQNLSKTVTIDTLDFRKYNFKVQSVVEYVLDYGNRTFKFTDYDCQSFLQEGEPVSVKLRVYQDNRILCLSKYDEIDYSTDFKALLDDQQFNIMNDDEVEASFWRIMDVSSPYQAKIDGVRDVWYWDYWRETRDEGGSDYKEHLFVEWDKDDTGRFTIWRGEECTGRVTFI